MNPYLFLSRLAIEILSAEKNRAIHNELLCFKSQGKIVFVGVGE
jgi:hypothetical protein